MSLNDGEIIERSLTQHARFAELYDRHQRVIYRYVARRIGVIAAEDVASETFLVAFAKRSTFRGGEDARPWLLGIATVLTQKFARQEARAWRGMIASDMARVDTDEIENADSRLDAAGFSRRLGRALARLPAGDRDALLLHTFGDLDYVGVSEALGIPVGTVRSRLHRVRQKLRLDIQKTSTQEEEKEVERVFDPAARAC